MSRKELEDELSKEPTLSVRPIKHKSFQKLVPVKHKRLIKIEKLSIEQYFINIKPYLGNITDEIKKSGEWKIHLTMKVNFM